MPTPPPVPPASRSPYGPDGEPKNLEGSARRVQDVAHRLSDKASAVVPHRVNLWPAVVGVALVGYVVGALIHRR